MQRQTAQYQQDTQDMAGMCNKSYSLPLGNTAKTTSFNGQKASETPSKELRTSVFYNTKDNLLHYD